MKVTLTASDEPNRTCIPLYRLRHIRWTSVTNGCYRLGTRRRSVISHAHLPPG